MQPTINNIDLRPIFPYHTLNKVDFDNFLYQLKRLFLVGRFEDEFHFLRVYRSSR